jgi:hypothetical protein
MAITFSTAQVNTTRAAIARKIKAANQRFRMDNLDYTDIELDSADVAWLRVNGSDESKVADKMLEFAQSGRPLDTFRLLTVKTEKDVPASSKHEVTYYLGCKKYRSDGFVKCMGFQSPADADEPFNRFVSTDGESTFMVLRSKGLLQLMSDTEIDTFVSGLVITLDLYVQVGLEAIGTRL